MSESKKGFPQKKKASDFIIYAVIAIVLAAVGVEGVSKELILEALRKCGASCEDSGSEFIEREEITKADFFVYGLTGGSNSSERRELLKKRLNLPENMTTNSILGVLNCLMTRDEFIDLMEELYLD